MEANELMVGDWVCLPSIMSDDKYLVQVLEIQDDCIKYYAGGKKMMVGFKYIEPIPLTPEIFEKNGFTKSTPPPGIHARCYELDNKKYRYNLTIADYNKYKRLLLNVDSEDSECFNIKCDYVHELQHALRLCKIEKEIEL